MMGGEPPVLFRGDHCFRLSCPSKKVERKMSLPDDDAKHVERAEEVNGVRKNLTSE